MSVENQSSQRSIRRRDILKLAGAVGGGAMLAACAPPPAPQAGAGAEMAEPIELEISVLQGAPVESVNELIKAAFTEQHPDVPSHSISFPVIWLRSITRQPRPAPCPMSSSVLICSWSPLPITALPWISDHTLKVMQTLTSTMSLRTCWA